MFICYIIEVAPDSSAEQAGILPGDVIVRLNDTATPWSQDIADAISASEEEVNLVTLYRLEADELVHYTFEVAGGKMGIAFTVL